ncbi:MAG: hypothetical protein KDB00_11535, partial [Planctomycetales bacterium]|nr:hypothetical protein [Planctomycetales bacterium]
AGLRDYTTITRAFTSARRLDKAAVTAAASARTTRRKTTIADADGYGIAAATVTPQTSDSGKDGPAFPAALAVVVPADVTGIDTIGGMVNPWTDIKFTTAGARTASAARSVSASGLIAETRAA